MALVQKEAVMNRMVLVMMITSARFGPVSTFGRLGLLDFVLCTFDVA